MSILSRRVLLTRGAAVAATGLLPSNLLRAANMPAVVSIRAQWQQSLAVISQDLIGLSYESAQLSAPDFFSAENTELIAFFRRLSPSGVLRLGGNLSEFTHWTPDAAPIVPRVRFRGVMPDPNAERRTPSFPVTPQAVQNLRAFLDKTGWRCMYGVNLARVRTDADQQRVVAEAKYAANVLGPKLIALQIGNEPNHYVLNKLRAPGYSFTDYFVEWSKLHRAIADVLPSARFAGPDVAEGADWVTQFATVAPKSVALLTGHHYAEGPPSSPAANLENLLAGSSEFTRHVEELRAASVKSGLPYAMAETNSCYNAGKQGVSDVFGAALWASDYVLQLARARMKGIYFHGGGDGWYTAIAGGSGEPFAARPIFYGLELCQSLIGGEMVPVEAEGVNAANVSVYAVQHPQRYVVINKGAKEVAVHPPQSERVNHALRLSAPSLYAKSGIELREQRLAPSSQIAVSAYSAAVFTLA